MQTVLITWCVNLHLVNTCVITWLKILNLIFSSRCLKFAGNISTVRTGRLPLTDKLSCNRAIYFSCTRFTSSWFTLRFTDKGLGATFGLRDQGPLLFILSCLQITFDLESTKTDVLYLHWALTRFMAQTYNLEDMNFEHNLFCWHILSK